MSLAQRGASTSSTGRGALQLQVFELLRLQRAGCVLFVLVQSMQPGA
jgi:hypothetical protein